VSSSRGKGRRKFTVDSLFQDTSPRGAGVRDLIDAKEINVDRVVPDPEQPRHTFDEESLGELAASIAQEGVLQPIAVRYDEPNDQYVIIHGERRWRASQIAGLSAIPAIVRDVPEERRLVHQLMENVVREDLNAVDRAAALRLLKRQMDDAPWERVAEAVGIRRSRLFQLLSTEKLVASVQDRIRAGELSEKQTRPLQGLSPQAQETLAEMLVDGMPEREAQAISRQLRDDTDYLELDQARLTDHIRAMRDEITGSETGDPSVKLDGEVLARALSELTGRRDLPEKDVEALNSLNATADLDGRDLEDMVQQIGLRLGRLAAGETQDDIQPRQLRALRRIIDLALKAQRSR
jgi:ParB family transcriptional regulator, chromosome partitioning protein